MDWGRQGGVIFAYIVVLLGYLGIVANMILARESYFIVIFHMFFINL
jgi:hypothetical protein